MASRQMRRLVQSASFAAAVAAVLAICPVTRAQYYVGQDGRSAEANNRLGSYGSNGQASPNNNIPNANDILYGNVTGLAAFQGVIPFRQPGMFTGALPPEPSQVLRQMAGNESSQPNYGQPEVWYAPEKISGTPAGLQEIPGNGAYVPVQDLGRQPQDYRLGNSLDIPAVSNGLPVSASGQPLGGGALVDTSANLTPTNLINAPIYGARETAIGPNGLPIGFVSGVSSGTDTSQTGLLASDLSQADLLRLRTELASSALTYQNQSANSGITATIPGTQVPIENGETNPPSTPLVQNQLPPPNTGAPVPPTPAPSQDLAANSSFASGSGNLSTGQITRQVMPPLPAPTEISPQYLQLRKLLDQYQAAHPSTDQEASRLFREALKARRAYEQSVASSSGQTPGVLPTPQLTLPGMANAPAPLPVGPISTSITAPGLRLLVQQGEDLARHQQYKDAISKFLDARQVDPNFPLVTVDLANAELGAGFYDQAEQYLRQAFLADPALLMGKYDLTSVVGPDRLDILTSDLKRVASTSDSATPVLLLAYVYYNTGDAAKAMDYLQLAQSRSGGNDELINALNTHWTLPQLKSPTQPSK